MASWLSRLSGASDQQRAGSNRVPVSKRVDVKAEWLLRQPSNGPVQEIRELIHNSRARDGRLNASRLWLSFEELQVDGRIRQRLIIEDDGMGMSFSELEAAFNLSPGSNPDALLSRYGEGMKLALFHLRKDSSSRIYLFARQGTEYTAARFGTDEDSFASVDLLPLPTAFMEDPGDGKDGDLVSAAGVSGTAAGDTFRKVAAQLTRQSTRRGPSADARSPYDFPGDLREVFLASERLTGKTSGLRIEVWDPIDGQHLQDGSFVGPAIRLGQAAQPHGARPMLLYDPDGMETDSRVACSSMFLPTCQEICTAQMLQPRSGSLPFPFAMKVFTQGVEVLLDDHLWAKAVSAGQISRRRRCRTAPLSIGGDMGTMQIMELSEQTAHELGTGIIFVWPHTDAVCNLVPDSPSFPGYDDFWSDAKDASRDETRKQLLWEGLCKLVGGEQHLQAMGLQHDEFVDEICRSHNTAGLRTFLYGICLDKRLALVQMSDTRWARFVDRTKMHITPLRPFAEALMRTLVQHCYQEYRAAVPAGLRQSRTPEPAGTPSQQQPATLQVAMAASVSTPEAGAAAALTTLQQGSAGKRKRTQPAPPADGQTNAPQTPAKRNAPRRPSAPTKPPAPPRPPGNSAPHAGTPTAPPPSSPPSRSRSATPAGTHANADAGQPSSAPAGGSASGAAAAGRSSSQASGRAARPGNGIQRFDPVAGVAAQPVSMQKAQQEVDKCITRMHNKLEQLGQASARRDMAGVLQIIAGIKREGTNLGNVVQRVAGGS